MTNKEKFLKLVSGEDTKTLAEVRKRIKNRAMLRESQQIALKVLLKLDDLGWSQKDLAREMGVTPQQITKITSGKENLTIETQIKLQNILDIPVLASYYEKGMSDGKDCILRIEKHGFEIAATAIQMGNNYQETTKLRLDTHRNSPAYYQPTALS